MKEKEDFYKLIGKDFDEGLVKNLDKAEEGSFDELVEDDLGSDDTQIVPGRWAVMNDNVYYPCNATANKLLPAVYSIEDSFQLGIYLKKKRVLSDNLLVLPDDNATMVLKHIEEFWRLKGKFKELGFLHKRGALLYGPPGSGKTSLVMQTMESIVGQKGIVLLGDYPPLVRSALSMVRNIEENTPIVVILEDIDELVYKYGDRALTETLDGESNVDNVLFLATTNYPERLPNRLIKRPSRFDVIEFIDFPTKEARMFYLQEKTDLAPSEIEVWAGMTNDFSIAHLKELMILVFGYEMSVEEGVDKIKETFMSNFEPFQRQLTN